MSGMTELEGYRIKDTVHTSHDTQILRAVAKSDGRAVILKMCQLPYPDESILARYRHEFAILTRLDGRGSVRALELIRFQNAPVLVLEDVGGLPLSVWMAEAGRSLAERVTCAVELARAAADLHGAGVVHRNLTPEHVLVHREGGRAAFVDLGLALGPDDKDAPRVSIDVFENRFWYLAPEATGRTGIKPDERADLYALGAIFYELLGGSPPFPSQAPLEVLHAQLALAPPPLTEGPAGAVPDMLRAVVEKLLAKNPDDRYQRATGLLFDLDRCLDELLTTGDVAPFVLGSQDRAARLRFSPWIYGRDAEWRMVEGAFRQARAGSVQWMAFTGPEGIGKSAFLHEVEERLRENPVCLGSGRFLDEDPDGPLGPFARAMGDVVRGLLELPDQDVEGWRRRLVSVLGASAPVLAALVPHLGELLAVTPAANLTGEARRVALESGLAHLADGLARTDAPLVLLLDDLQWAESPALEFLGRLITDARAENFLVVTSLRTDDGPPVVGVEKVMSTIRQETAALTELELAPLAEADIERMVSESLGIDVRAAKPVTAIVYKKTMGNPFGARQLLELWHQQGALRPDPGESGWIWDTEAMERSGSMEHGTGFLVERVAALPEATGQLLGLAAVLGREFEAPALARLLGLEDDDALPPLMADALQSRLVEVVPDGTGEVRRFRFAHPIVLQAALGLMGPDESEAAHLSVARFLEETLGDGRQSRAIELADHWNQALDLVDDVDERRVAARANLAAGRVAAGAGRYNAALMYFETGTDWLPEDRWEHDAELTADLLFGQMDMLGNTNQPQERRAVATHVAAHSPRMQDKLEATATLLSNVTAVVDEVEEVVLRGLRVLREVGIDVPRRVSRRQAMEQYEVVQALMAGRTREDLLAAPALEDPVLRAAMRLLTLLGNGAGNDRLWYGYLTLRNAELSLRHGYSASTGESFMGALSVTGIGRHEVLEENYELGLTGLEVSRRFDQRSKMNSLSAFSMHINHWRRPLRESLELVREFENICRVGGEEGHALLHSPAPVLLELAAGFPLAAIHHETASVLERAHELEVMIAQFLLPPVIKALDILTAHAPYERIPFEFSSAIASVVGADATVADCYLTTLLGFLFGHLDDVTGAGATALAALDVRADMIDFLVPETLFYYGLTLAQVQQTADAETRRQVRSRLSRIRRLFREWALASPANYQHKLDLLDAEMRRHVQSPRGQEALAFGLIDQYDVAIEGAARYGFLHNQAIANELAGEFALSRGKERLARMYLVEARYLYRQWGAAAKTARLEALYAHLLPPEQANLPVGRDIGPGAAAADGLNLSTVDLETVVRSSQVISGEVHLDQLLSRLLRLAIENAGAERGVLVLLRDAAWVVEAVGDVHGLMETMQGVSIDEAGEFMSLGIAQYVLRTQEPVILADAGRTGRFTRDPYVRRHEVRSVLCLPVVKQGRAEALLYLENNLGVGAFTSDRVEVLQILSGQAAISIDNARMYETMDRQIQERTEALRRSQQQIVESDRMASLGQLTAGVAHEINNPVNFVVSSAAPLRRDVEDILDAVARYEELLAASGQEGAVARIRRDVQMDDVMDEVKQLLTGIEEGGKRTAEIVKGLRSFSRVDEGDLKPVSITEGIESTLVLLRRQYEPQIEIVREYEPAPEVMCFPGQLNQVFMNLLVNAIQAIHGQGTIRIRVRGIEDAVEVQIADSGQGMPEDVKKRIFEPFFTTKDVGVGTGLGLAITYGIIERHQGSIEVDSVPGEGTTFTLRFPLVPDRVEEAG